ncbi:hypothetical protein R3P38DRAFT_3313146 [Favolaschia claudopus]|uniref:Cytochrome b5 heme-binding domain-containing protein n=1 Tax=Favolaschia claudopus TaxID=2862362 RepID=A0AAW0C2I5_9AGAR
MLSALQGIFAADAPATLVLHGPPSLPFNASSPLHPSLASFSLETAFFIEFLGNTTDPNTLTTNLLQNLKDRTGTPAEVRIGGITADSTYWDASLDTALSNFIVNGTVLVNTTIGPQFWTAAKTLLPRGTKITMNLDLNDFDFTGALTVAESAVAGLNPGQLVAFEIGNEPDQYSPPLTPQTYNAVWEPWSKNISDTLHFKAPMFQIGATAIDPLWPYDAPGASSALDCKSALADGANDDGTVKSCSEHTYQYSLSARNLVPTRSLSGNIILCLALGRLALYIHQGGPLALQSSTQLNHGGLSRYDLWYPVDALNGEKQVFPSYSAYLFITETLGHSKTLRIANLWPGRISNGSTVTTAGGDFSAGQSVVYGFWEDSAQEHPSKIALLNLQIFNQTQAGPRPTTTFDISAFLPPKHKSVNVKRLEAPGADVTFGNQTTWAGQTFALDSNGLAKGKHKEETIRGGKIVVEASSAVLPYNTLPTTSRLSPKSKPKPTLCRLSRMASTKQFTAEEVSKHNKEGDLWIIVDSKVFDLSKFAGMHPGGLSVLLDEDIAGQDATEAFFGLHRHEVLLKPQYARLQIGTIAGEKQSIFPRETGALSNVPYAEPTWLNPGFHSPYYTEGHRRFQTALRKFVEEEIGPDSNAREEDGKRPSQSVFDAMARTNIIAMRLGPGRHLKGRVLMDGLVKPEEFDYFHELIMAQEGARLHGRGYIDGLGGGTYIGLPPIMNFGQPAVRDRILEEVFSGKKHVCLAITEAFAGSDVAGLKTFAKKTDKGWVVTGTKKWITGGQADYFTVGCRSENGMVVLVIPRGEGIETKPIKTSYSSTAGTAYITFDNVLVPFENTLGEDGDGLRVILSNFNHERWGMTCNSVSGQRAIVEECLKWATQRKVFGKPLVSQPVIRAKLAAMISRVESAQAWLENVTYQMCHMNYKQQSTHLAGQIAFAKMYATKTAQETATDAVQIFGGRGITKSGLGKNIEHCAMFPWLNLIQF